MANENVLFAPGADPEEAAIRSRLQYAQALRQSQTPLQGRMVGDRFVGASPLEGLANMLKSYGGRVGEEQAMQQAGALNQQRKTEGAADLQGYVNALKGTPAKPGLDGDDGAYVPPQDAVAGDPQKAMALALASRNPVLQQAGLSQIKEMTAGPKWEKAERPKADGSVESGFINANSRDPWATFQVGGTAPVKGIAINGQLVSPMTGSRIGEAVPEQLKPDSFVTRDASGALVPNAPVIAARAEVAKAGKPTVSVDARQYSTQESEQSKAYGKELGDIRGNITKAGYEAPKRLAQLTRMEELLAGIDGGAAAPAMADVASFAQSMGIKLDPKLGNKQGAEALTREMAGSLRQPGTGPMTDKDFDNFMKQVPSLSKTAEGRAQISKTMRAAIERDVRASQFAREYAAKNGGTIDDNFFGQLQDFYIKNPVVTPSIPARNANGDGLPRFEAEKEKRYEAWKKQQGIQ